MSKRPTPRLGLTREEAAEALGMSINSFDRHVKDELRCLRLGKLRIYPVREIERYLEEHATLTLGEAG